MMMTMDGKIVRKVWMKIATGETMTMIGVVMTDIGRMMTTIGAVMMTGVVTTVRVATTVRVVMMDGITAEMMIGMKMSSTVSMTNWKELPVGTRIFPVKKNALNVRLKTLIV